MYNKNLEMEKIPFLTSEEESMQTSTTNIMLSSSRNDDVDVEKREFGCPGPPIQRDIESRRENYSLNSAMSLRTMQHSKTSFTSSHQWKLNFRGMKKILNCVLAALTCRLNSQRCGTRNFFVFLLFCFAASLIVYLYQMSNLNSTVPIHKPVSVIPSMLRQKKLLFPKNQCNIASSKRLDHEKVLSNKDVISDKMDPNIKQWNDRNNIHSAIRPQKYQTRSPARVLLICKTSLSILCQLVQEKLESHRISYKVSVAGKNIPDLIKSSKGKGKYVSIFFEEFQSYLSMDKWNREILDKYCRSFDVGIVAFITPQPSSNFSSMKGFKSSHLIDLYGNHTGHLPISFNPRTTLNEFTVTSYATMLRILKGGRSAVENKPMVGHWVTMTIDKEQQNAQNYIPVVLATNTFGKETKEEAIVLQDQGMHDGIQKVLFSIRRIPQTMNQQSSQGNPKRRKKSDLRKQSLHWIQHVLFLDALGWTSKEKIQLSLTRYMMVDIDDIFTGKNRLRENEVEAMRKSQQRISKMFDGLSGFQYNLGFSGATFKKGPDLENKDEDDKGDEALIRYKDEFTWFPHEWQHMQPHKQDNVTILTNRMVLNRKFANEQGLVVNTGYAVSPHHSGVFPVHEQLYDSWKHVWNISVTSTEEYPHLNPKRNNIRLPRRGFIHARTGIRVLPRQTCGLFTKNLYYKEYPNGPEVLEESIQGGELFQTFVNNPVSIFMTHMPNYAFDRLAPYTFESVLSMLKCWTNLDLRTATPKELGDIYFEYFPDEKIPMWSNPCEDKRHEEIWSASKTCQRLPDFLVIGPQKTGTTALYKFLQVHPSIESNFQSPTTFEELQFFSNNRNYEKGIDWYMSFFPSRELNNSAITSIQSNNEMSSNDDSIYDEESLTILFEKSATYFDREVVPERAYELLPDAFLIAILISPAKRAHSWYQHQRAHGDETAMQYSFHEVITANTTSTNKALKSLQSRCLEPGKYASHIERWLQFYGPQQIYIVDGEQLTKDPIPVMNNLQHFLSVKPFIDYDRHLRYDVNKGYYCLAHGKRQCLGSGKGREYNHSIETKTMKFLQEYYRLSNEALLKLLKNRLGYEVPQWLYDDLNEFSENSENEEPRDEN